MSALRTEVRRTFTPPSDRLQRRYPWLLPPGWENR